MTYSSLFIAGCSLIVGVTSGFLFKQAAGTLSIYRLNLVSWTFYYHLLLQTFFGVSLAMVGIRHYALNRASDEGIMMAYWVVNYTMIAMPIGMILTQRVFGGGNIKAKVHAYFEKPLSALQSRRDSALVIFWSLISIVAALATAYSYYYIRDIPFLAALMGSSSVEVAVLRTMSKYEFQGNVYVRNIFAIGLAPIASYVAYGYRLLRQGELPYRLWFYGTVLVAFFALTMTGEKQPVIAYFITLFFIKSYVEGGSSKRELTFVMATVAGVIVLFYLLLGGRVDISLTSGPIGRMLISQMVGLPLTFDLFPGRVDFLWGASFPEWIVSAFGVEHVRPARLLMEYYNPRGVEANTAGVMNSLYMAEAWANFSWIGVIVAPFFVGGIVQLAYNWLLTHAKTPMFVAILAYFMFGFPITGGVVDFVWNVMFMIILFVIVAAILFRGMVLPGSRTSRTISVPRGHIQ